MSINTDRGWIVQIIEDHPHNPDWWRFGRPYWVTNDEDLPGSLFPENARWAIGSIADLKESQAVWDRANPHG